MEKKKASKPPTNPPTSQNNKSPNIVLNLPKVEVLLPKKKKQFLCPIETLKRSRKAELVQTAKQVALKSLKFVHPNTEGVLQMVASSNLA